MSKINKMYVMAILEFDVDDSTTEEELKEIVKCNIKNSLGENSVVSLSVWEDFCE